MARCDICLLNPEGMFNLHCAYPGEGCKNCPKRCKNKAFYVGGMNVCSEHKEAWNGRMAEYWEKAGKLQTQDELVRELQGIK